MASIWNTPSPDSTIQDVEQTVQNGLEALRGAPLSNEIVSALKFLVPTGYRPVAQFEEDGRKKRSNAAASNWNPDTGEIVIYFEKIKGDSAPEMPTRNVPLPVNPKAEPTPAVPPVSQFSLGATDSAQLSLDVSEAQLQQCCLALADAEKAGKAFISLTWFRDTALQGQNQLSWSSSPAVRHAVLTKAIEVGAILTGTVPNPKSAQHPTATIRLNRESTYAKAVTPRFQPIRARDGASASEIILRDRGERF